MLYLFDNTSVQSLEILVQAKLARGFLNFGHAKTGVSSHFSKKNERSTNVLKIAGVRSTEQSGIIGVNFFDTYLIYFLLFQQ